jgi:hypothetical protein
LTISPLAFQYPLGDVLLHIWNTQDALGRQTGLHDYVLEEELRQLLAFETKFDVHAFLTAHEVPLHTLADLEHDRQTSAQLGL